MDKLLWFCGILAVCILHLSHADMSTPLVTFDELSEVVLDRYSLRSVEAIEEDLLNPGGFIVGNQHSVAVIAPNLTVQILAGQENETAFQDGIGSDVYFSTVQHVTQYRDGADIIVADYGNHCIRIVNRATASVTTFAGSCTRQGDFESRSEVSARRAQFAYPVASLYVKQQNIFYYLLEKPAAVIVKHNLTTDKVHLVYKDIESFSSPFAMIIDSSNTFLYVNHLNGISKFDTESWKRTIVTGTNSSTPSSGDRKTKDGTLSTARFRWMYGMAWLIRDQVIIVNQYYTDRALRIVNLVDDDVSTWCKGEESTTPRFTVGNMTTCKVNEPLGITVVNDSVYIGEESGKLVGRNPRKGHIVKLTYNQPICQPPPDSDFTGNLSLIQDRYFNNQKIKYTCNSGFGIGVDNDTIECVRDWKNETLSGKWEYVQPFCEKPYLDYITPKRGQKAGGTMVTIAGTFPSDVRLSIRTDDGYVISTPTPARKHSRQLLFRMPPNELNRLGKYIIHIGFGENDTTIDAKFYTYLFNPTIRLVSRTAGIARGGLEMVFHGNYISSSTNYTLIIFEKNPSNTEWMKVCQPNYLSNSVVCNTPDLTDVFKQREKRSVDGQMASVNLSVSLLSDGKLVSGAIQRPFTVVNSSPTFHSSNTTMLIEFDIRTEKAIKLHGTNIDIGLYKSDYTVVLTLIDLSELVCNVTVIYNTHLLCEPPSGDIVIPLSDSKVEAQISVKIGLSESMDVGKVAFYESKPHIQPELAGIVTPVVISVAAIIAAIVIYFVLKKRIGRGRGVTGRTNEDYEGDDERESFKISINIKVQLEDMYIDPLDLSFDLKSNPIGKGHFGKVYVGQLKVKGSILKTVAVKTLKETDDINAEQVEDFLSEATFLKYYNHVNILSTMGVVWRKGDRPHVVLPYMALGDLCSLVHRPEMRFTNGDLMHFGMQIATGMEYLIDNKCLHRDLAARNCLVNDKYLVKIADFGMSKDVYVDNYYRESEKDKPMPVRWMALESLQEGVYTSYTEVWSFGVLMWELFTRGKLPYPGVDSCDMELHLLRGHRLSRPTYTHPIIFELMSRCWLATPADRPTFTQLKEFFEFCITNEGKQFGDQEVTSNNGEDGFAYSYVQNLTKNIPSDYSQSGEFTEEDNVNYIDKTTILDYEQPMPDATAPASTHSDNAPVHGLASLPNGQQVVNEYTSIGRFGHHTELDLNNHKHGAPIPSPRLTLTVNIDKDSNTNNSNDIKFSESIMSQY